MSFVPGQPRTHGSRPGGLSGGAWVAVVIGGVVGVFLLLVVAASAIGLHAYAHQDHLGLVDRPDVVASVEDACAQLRLDLATVPPADGRSRAEVMRQQDAAVLTMTDRVRRLGRDVLEDDHPMPEWVEDWEDLIAARVVAATDVGAGRAAAVVVPETEDGYPITYRMQNVGVDCRVPRELVTVPRG